MKIKIQLLPHYVGPPLPNDGSVLDLFVAGGDLTVEANRGGELHTGMILSIPKNYCGIVVPVRALTRNTGTTIFGAPYIIDWNYKTDEIIITVVNFSGKDFTFTNGMKIAQMVLVETKEMKFIQCFEP